MNRHELITYKHNQIAVKLDQLSFIYAEIARRMSERLDYIKLDPKNILDLSNGLSLNKNLLAKRYQNARIYQGASAINILQHEACGNSLFRRLFNPVTDKVCLDYTNLPIANGSVDFVWSNLQLPFISAMEDYFREILRVLGINGCLLISSLGVDSLYQLRELGLRTYDFPDMHMIGDLLLKLGFSDPVTDVEHITLEYDDIKQLLKDIRLIGCGAVIEQKNRFTRLEYTKLEQRAASFTQNGKLPLKLEVFYAHAWKNKDCISSDRSQVIQFHPRKS